MKNFSVVLNKVIKRYYLEKPRTLKKWFKTLLSPFHKLTVIHNFSLKVKQGEFILINGPNGSGKTTLLKLIAGITYPDKGQVKVIGKVVPLIELGAGFNFELTGRENILINATILGIEKRKIEKIIPEIMRFSGVKDFIDIPVKRYSTGMIARLAFSIAAYSEPDVLLLDEILAVGDVAFRRKTQKKLNEFQQRGVTIILSSHSDYQFPYKVRTITLKSLHQEVK